MLKIISTGGGFIDKSNNEINSFSSKQILQILFTSKLSIFVYKI